MIWYKVAVDSLALGCSSYTWVGSSPIRGQYWGHPANERLVLLLVIWGGAIKVTALSASSQPSQESHKHCHRPLSWPLMGQNRSHASDGSPVITVKKAFIRGLGCYVVKYIHIKDWNNIFLLSSLFFVWFIHWDLAFPVSKTSREGCLWHLCPHIFSEIPPTYTATFWHEFCWGHEYKIVLNIWN